MSAAEHDTGGRVIGNYRVTRLLGEGGMGAVYAAEHRLLGRPAAIKVLLDSYARQPQVVQRFFTEARAATAIRHPGIVEIYDFGHQDDGSAFIAMELLEGEELESRLRRLGRLPPVQAVHLAMQIASALAAAHGHGVVHRDLKPANIFLVPDPQVVGGERIKLLDFGIAKVAHQTQAVDDSQRTQVGMVMGTPAYMAPEQCVGAAHVDARADLYSLGCILFEMVCGRPPMSGPTAMDVISAHLRQPPPRPRDIVPELSPELDAVILRLLEKDPARRIATAAELEAALGLLVAQGAAAVSLAPPSRRRRAAPILAAIALTAVAATVAAIALAPSPSPSPTPTPSPSPSPSPSPPPPPPQFAPLAEASPPSAGETRWILRSTPSGAEILLGDDIRGVTPIAVTLAPSSSTELRVRLYDHVEQTVALDGAGGDRTIELVPYVKLKFLSTPPGAVIYAPTGESLGVTPGEIGVPPGTAALTFVLRRDGYRDQPVDVVPDRPQKLRIRLNRSREASP